MTNLVTVIDFSSSGLRIVTGYYFKGTVYALQAMEGEPISLDENGYLNKKETLQSLALLLQEAKSRLKGELGVYIALLPPDGFMVNSQETSCTTIDETSKIVQKDYANCISQINKKAKIENKKIVYDHPTLFGDDNKKDYENFPINAESDNLYVFADVMMVDESSFNHYDSILKELNLNIYMYLVAPFATVSFINFFGGPKSYICLDIEKDYTYVSYISKKRMNDTNRIPFGIDQMVEIASSELNLDKEKTYEYLKLYGLLKDPGFLFVTKENKTLEDTSAAFKKGLAPLIEMVNNFITKYNISPNVAIVISGIGADIDDLDKYLLNEFKRDNMVLFSKVIGARNKVYTNCVGAILISSFSYQNPIYVAEKLGNNQTFKADSFSRGK